MHIAHHKHMLKPVFANAEKNCVHIDNITFGALFAVKVHKWIKKYSKKRAFMKHSYGSKLEPDKNKRETENVTHYVIFIIQRWKSMPFDMPLRVAMGMSGEKVYVDSS